MPIFFLSKLVTMTKSIVFIDIFFNTHKNYDSLFIDIFYLKSLKKICRWKDVNKYKNINKSDICIKDR